MRGQKSIKRQPCRLKLPLNWYTIGEWCCCRIFRRFWLCTLYSVPVLQEHAAASRTDTRRTGWRRCATACLSLGPRSFTKHSPADETSDNSANAMQLETMPHTLQ